MCETSVPVGGKEPQPRRNTRLGLHDRPFEVGEDLPDSRIFSLVVHLKPKRLSPKHVSPRPSGVEQVSNAKHVLASVPVGVVVNDFGFQLMRH